MRPRGVAFGGWLHQDVPASARVVLVAGRVAIPAEGSSASLAGTTPFGGWSFLYGLHRDPLSGRDLRCRIIAAGFGLYDAERSYHLLQASAGSADVATGLGLPDRPIPFRHASLRVLSLLTTDSGYITRGAAGDKILYVAGAGPSDSIQDGVIPAASDPLPWFIDSADGDLSLTITTRPEAARYDLTMALQILPIDVASDTVHAVGARDLSNVAAIDPHPQPLESGGAPAMTPYVPAVRGAADLAMGEALGVKVTRAAGTVVGPAAYVTALVAIAVWDPVREA